MELNYSARGCPICSSTHSQVLFEQRFEQLSGAHLLYGYDVSICDECGAGYADKIPPQSEFDRYYRELSKYDYSDRPTEARPAEDQRYLDMADGVAPHIPTAEARIFEIGSGAGQLLAALKARGFTNVCCSDPSPGCVKAAAAFGVPGIVCTIFDAPTPSVPYEFLILTGVMEHIRDLHRAVAQFHRLLRPGGRVYLEVPDGSRYMARLDAPFQEFSVEHINFFSAQSLTNLMQTNGFRAVATGEATRSLHESSCPTVYGVYERTNGNLSLRKDEETEKGLRNYIAGCSEEDIRIRRRISDAVSNQGQMIVWGTGAHTLRLLANGGLHPSQIALFVDSNPNYQNRSLRGVPVVAPAQLNCTRQPILISSKGFQNEIQQQIRKQLHLTNPLILLYDAPDT
ncbi:MAG: class I SAM-dependent methyltransferase [Bryobacteraceae bacterium]